MKDELGHNGGLLYIVLGVAIAWFLGIALLSAIPCTRRRISMSCLEAFWVASLVLSVTAITAAVHYRQEICDVYHLHQHICYDNDENALTATGDQVFQLRIALTFDVIVTVSHLALPIRWAIIVQFDALVVVSFCVLSLSMGLGPYTILYYTIP